MGKRPKFLILGFFLALICLLPLHAQKATNAPADSNATAANSAPTGQAPDDMTKLTAIISF